MLCHQMFLIYRNVKPGDLTHAKLAFSLVFPVKLLQLLCDIQHFQQSYTVASCLTYLKILREQAARVTVSVCACLRWVTVLEPVTKWGQRSNSVPITSTGTTLFPLFTSFLCGSLRLDTEERERESSEKWIEKIKVHFEALSSRYLTAPHSQTGVGCNDTIVSRWPWWRGGSLLKSFLTGTFLLAFTNAHIELTNWLRASDWDKHHY